VSELAAFVYIMASRRNGTIYIGVTSDLFRRATAHREGLIPGFTHKYCVRKLVYYEVHEDIREAITREKALKNRRRAAKISLIETVNPDWKDLYDDLL
jgi:predicted GIY-YIG superfamily endonuclease